MTSAVTFAIVSAAATNESFMDPGLLVGLIFTGCVPTTISSNVVMTRQAHGNTALTVVQSTIGNFLGPFLTPVLLTMYTSRGAWYTAFLPQEHGGYSEIYRRVFKQLGLSIFLPMVFPLIVVLSSRLTDFRPSVSYYRTSFPVQRKQSLQNGVSRSSHPSAS